MAVDRGINVGGPMPKMKLLLAFLIAFSSATLSSSSSWAQQLLTPLIPKVESRRVCSKSSNPHVWSCNAHVVTSSLAGLPKASGVVSSDSAPSGFGPADLQPAYNLVSLSASAGAGRTIAIVDAMDDPNAEADLAVYRSTFGLPPCTSASGCFQKVNQLGATSPLPAPDGGWAEEISLDLEIASAICPNCNLLLLESNSATDDDLGTAVNTASAWPGVVAISNSYGSTEDSTISATCSSYFDHPGIAITVSTGDADFGAEGPATCTNVTAVGGTSLVLDSTTRGWTETVWNTTTPSEGTGSGCSGFEPKPSWETDTACKKRMEADVSAVADPATGVAVYDTYPNTDGVNGWAQFGGTSVSAPLIAGVYALATLPAPTDYPASYAWANPAAFYDVISGNNGFCTIAYFCTAEVGYDGPSGWGTPNAVAGFEPPSASDFSISASPASLSLQQETSGTSTISTAIISGSAQTLNLAISGVPAGATASVSPASISAGATSTLSISAGAAAPGIYTIVVTATGTTTHSTNLVLTVTAPVINDFSISVNPLTLSLPQKTSGTTTISTAITSGSAQTVSLSVSGLPLGATASISPSSIISGGSATLTVNAGTAAAGAYTILITGTGISNIHSASMSLIVTAPIPDFTITASPSILTVNPAAFGIFTVNVSAMNGFSGRVNLTVAGFPSKVVGAFLPASIKGSGTALLIFFVGPRQAAGTFPLTVTGTSGSIQHTFNLTLTVR
jgi:subtilase family serine protease